MPLEVWAMIGAGIGALIAGFILVRDRFQAASGIGKVIPSGPVFEAAPLAVFATEHFTAARDLMPLVPRWMPGPPLGWVYFVGAALLAAAVSFIAFRYVRWSAALLALMFLTFVAMLDLPNLPKDAHDRFFWILTVRETSFAAGAMVLAGSVWPSGNAVGVALRMVGRRIVAAVMVFYAIEHFLHPRNVPGVPLEKMTPDWIPAPVLIAYLVGVVLLVAGLGLFFARTSRIAAAGSGTMLLLVTVFFYGPICIAEIRSPLAVEGLNYLYDTMLFAATALLAGFSAGDGTSEGAVREPARWQVSAEI